jgi:hypothetical protein
MATTEFKKDGTIILVKKVRPKRFLRSPSNVREQPSVDFYRGGDKHAGKMAK